MKTNVMRILEHENIMYTPHSFNKNTSSTTELPIYKTLVTVGKSKENYVFVIPVTRELDLKKAAKAVNEKTISMIKEKELLPLTGYVHGGCSPIGMKRQFVTTVDESAKQLKTIIFSAGKVGHSVEIAVEQLEQVTPCQFASVCR